ncbi:MAG: sugar phosphorylase [Oceanipulchritudo sp.]
MLSQTQRQSLQKRLQRLYGDQSTRLVSRFEAMLGRYGIGSGRAETGERWDHRTCVLITYADTLREKDRAPLKTLHSFLGSRLRGVFSTIHILPFFPWSSDDGFSVIDFREVHREYGNWDNVSRMGEDFELMFDLVLNHCSRKSGWFRDFVTGIAPARWYFLPMDPATDLSLVVRPRPWPLLTKTATRDGPVHVWTTFSEDQVDLNWQNPDVLFEFLDILFLYLSKGCRIFRLDAVAFLWKRVGTSCLHLPETHEIVKFFREVLNIVAPRAILLTETNVPHEENISYFGEDDEAHMVYNFSLPPLLLYSLLAEKSSLLSQWARSLPELSPHQSFFNFTASHDGIGVRPLQGLLPEKEIDRLISHVRSRGGLVSMKKNSDGSESPYELNITYRDALDDPGHPETGMTRFLLSQAIVLAFKGVPAIYIHSLLGTPNDLEGVKKTGQNRSINRKKWNLPDLEKEIDTDTRTQARIFRKLSSWIRIRNQHPAFHPGAKMEVLDFGESLFAFLRTSRTGVEKILCLFNLGGRESSIGWLDCFPRTRPQDSVRELLSNKMTKGNDGAFVVPPYQAKWLMIKGGKSPERKRKRNGKSADNH